MVVLCVAAQVPTRDHLEDSARSQPGFKDTCMNLARLIFVLYMYFTVHLDAGKCRKVTVNMITSSGHGQC